jgi:hypothetical protein
MLDSKGESDKLTPKQIDAMDKKNSDVQVVHLEDLDDQIPF